MKELNNKVSLDACFAYQDWLETQRRPTGVIVTHAVDSFREGMLYAFNKYGCWQPVSEQPDEDGEYLVLTVWGPTKDMPFYAKFENGEWSIPQVKWWIKKPNINDWKYVNNKED